MHLIDLLIPIFGHDVAAHIVSFLQPTPKHVLFQQVREVTMNIANGMWRYSGLKYYIHRGDGKWDLCCLYETKTQPRLTKWSICNLCWEIKLLNY